jgi:hypothetical protein
MNQPQAFPHQQSHQQSDFFADYGFKIVLIVLGGAIGFLLLPAVVVGAVAAILFGILRLRWWTLLISALLVFGVFASLDIDPIERGEKVMHRSHKIWTSGKPNTFKRMLNRSDGLWKLGLPATIPLGLALGAVGLAWAQRSANWWEPHADAQSEEKARSERARAAKRVRTTPDEIAGRAVLGVAATGDLSRDWIARKPFGASYLVYDEHNLGRHIVVIGQPGSGKTVSLMRLAYLAAKVYGWRVYFLDGKGDYSTQKEFVATMLDAGITEGQLGIFPAESFDGWRTSGSLDDRFAQLLNRLLGVVQFSEPYYEDATRSFVAQALMVDGSLPASSGELLERLDRLTKASPVEQRREAMGVSLRYRAFFDSFRGKLDGSWSFEDKRAAYVLLEGLAQPKEAGKLAAYLFESFKHFATHAKHPNERVLLIVDEFPAIQADADAAGLVERLRSFGCSVALSAQSFDGLGLGKERIVSAARSLILHSCPEAEELIKLAGTLQAQAVTSQLDQRVGPTGRGSTTPEQRFRVDPNLLGSLGEGEAFVVSQRRAQLVRVARRVPSESSFTQAIEILRPKVQLKRPQTPNVTPPEESELKQTIDW